MSDTISRQAAIDATWSEPSYTDPLNVLTEVRDRLKALPSAQPEQKKGEWINRSLNILYPAFERYTCSVCGKHSYSYDFCPHCGSYNGGDQSETD